MKKGILVLGMVLMGVGVFGQGNWLWARQATGTGTQDPNSIITDVLGNIYVTGGFKDSAITFGSITLTNAGDWDMFIVKYDANGNVLWAKNVGSNSRDGGCSIATDVFGNIYVTGFYSSSSLVITPIFGGPITLTNNGSDDIFVIKYDTNGNVIWAKSYGGTSTDDSFAITCDALGNIYITGGFNSPFLVFGTTTLANPGSGFDMFIVKYDTNGNVIWAKSTGGNNWDNGYSVAIDTSGIYVTGYFSNPTIVFGSTTLTLFGSSGSDMFIVKYDANGNVLWAKNGGGSTWDFGTSIAVDVSGNVYVTGYFDSQSAIFGSDTLTNISANYDMFIVKYNSNGNVLRAKSAGGNNNDKGLYVATDVSGIYVTGGFDSPNIVFGFDTLYFPGGGSDPMFFVKYDFNGNIICLTILPSGGDDNCAIAPDGFGNVYLAGDFYNVNPFILGTDSLSLTSLETFFIAKYNCNVTTVNITQLPTPDSQLTLYPNPTTSNLTIAFTKNTKKVLLTITDITGKLIYTATASEIEKMNVNTNGFAEGVYNVKIQTDDSTGSSTGSASSPPGDVVYKKLIVEK